MARSRPSWLSLVSLSLITLAIVLTAVGLLAREVELIFASAGVALVAAACRMVLDYQQADWIEAQTRTITPLVTCPGQHCGHALVALRDLRPWCEQDVCMTCHDAELVALRDRMLAIEARDQQGAA